MIRFACPNCQKSLRHAELLAKVACPRCGQKIRVPSPPPAAGNPTVLGDWQSAPPPARTAPSASAAVDDDDYAYDDLEVLSPGRAPRDGGEGSEPTASPLADDKQSGTSNRTLWQALGITACLFLVGFLLTLFLVQRDANLASETGNLVVRLVIGIGLLVALAMLVGGIVGLVHMCNGIATKCPECGKWWGKVYLGRRIIERKKCYGLVTRTAYSYSSGSYSGRSSHSGSIHHSGHGGTIHCATSDNVGRLKG
jgi:hypothetical protein